MPGRVVGVVIRFGHHGQYLAGVDIHDQCLHSHCAVYVHALAHGSFGKALYGRIDGQAHAAAVHRRRVFAHRVGQLIAPAVNFVYYQAILAAQIFVQLLFQPALPDSVAAATAARYVEAYRRLTGSDPIL